MDGGGVVGFTEGDEDRVEIGIELGFFDAEAGGGVTLGVCVHDEGALPGLGEDGRHVHSGRGFSDTPFLIDNPDNRHGA